MNPGLPVTIEIFSQDTCSGIGSINVLAADNANVIFPPFSPGTNDAVSIRAEKINPSQSSQVQLEVVDVAGNNMVCDPVITMVIREKGRPITETFTDIPEAECYVNPNVAKAGWLQSQGV